MPELFTVPLVHEATTRATARRHPKAKISFNELFGKNLPISLITASSKCFQTLGGRTKANGIRNTE
jgi:hypothetical protein